MELAAKPVAPSAPIFAVEVIDEHGVAWLYGPTPLAEALRLSADLERDALPGREPRISIPATLVGRGLQDE